MKKVSTPPTSIGKRVLSIVMSIGLISALLAVAAPSASADAVMTQTFGYTGSVQTFTVPAGVTSMGVTLTGGQGGRGGTDAAGPSPAGGFVGQLQGTIAVTPGQVLTIGVGSGGGSGTGGNTAAAAGSAGNNPLDDYDGAKGGAPGNAGSSGGGGGSGAATVLRLAEGVDLVAGGGGGSGGSGQFAPIIGRLAEDNFVGRSDITSTNGRQGLSANEACGLASCDGGGSGAGGGGAQGGERGADQYGGASATEWFGFGGYPGSNSDSGVAGLSASYQYVTTNGVAGSVVLSFNVGVPDPPRSVVGAAGNGIIDVYWLAPASPGTSPITDYIVKYSTNPAGPFTTFNDGVSTDRRATITGLTNGTSYYLQVLAVNAVGESLPSAVSSFPTVPTATPDPKPILLYAIADDASADLEWSDLSSPGATVTDYQVEYATNSGGPWTTFVHAPTTDQDITVTGLTNGTPYLFRVAAVTTDGQEPFSNLASATPVGSPTAPTITSIDPLSSALKVWFTAPSSNGGSPITSYQYQLDGGAWVTAPQTTSPLIIGGLNNGQTYSVALRAVTAASTGAASAPVSATPFGLPGMVPGFTATPGANSVTLNWDGASPNGSAITTYNIVQWTTASAGSIISSFTTASGADRTYTVTGLAPGVKYFTIEATNAAGTGPRTPTRVTAEVGGTVPAAPTVSSIQVNSTNVTLEWAHGAAGSSAISGYLIRYIDGADVHTTLKQSATAGTSTSVTLPSGVDPYSIEIADVSAAGIGAFRTVRPPMVTSGAATLTPSGTDADLAGSGNANGEATTFAFQLATDEADLGTPDGVVIASDPAAGSTTTALALSATTAGLEPGTTYYYRAVATSGVMTAIGATGSFTTQVIIDFDLDDANKDYDGDPAAVEATTQPAGITLVSVYTGIDGTAYGPTSVPPTDAGDYSVTTSVTTPGLSGSRTATFTIDRSAQVLSFAIAGGSVTKGSSVTPTPTSSAGLGSVIVIIKGEGTVCQLDGTNIAFLGAGDCVIQANQAGDQNYMPASASLTFTVAAGSTPSDDDPTDGANSDSGSGSGSGSGSAANGGNGGSQNSSDGRDGRRSNSNSNSRSSSRSRSDRTPDRNLALTGGEQLWLLLSGVTLLGCGLSIEVADRRRKRDNKAIPTNS